MENLKLISENALNSVFVKNENKFNGHHNYEIRRNDNNEILLKIQFQEGARKDLDSVQGILDLDLLYIVRDRIQTFQKGEFACRENALVLTKVEEAIMWSEARVKNREKRKVLGTYNK